MRWFFVADRSKIPPASQRHRALPSTPSTLQTATVNVDYRDRSLTSNCSYTQEGGDSRECVDEPTPK